MRFCPFCAQENTDDARECGHCGKRLPPPRTPPPRPPSLSAPIEKPKVPARPAPRSRPLAAPADRPALRAERPAPAPSASPDGETVVDPPQKIAPTGTLLGVAALDPATVPTRLPSPGARPSGPTTDGDSARRQTQPLNVATAASVVRRPRSSGFADDEEEDAKTIPQPKQAIDSDPLVIGDEADTRDDVPLPPPRTAPADATRRSGPASIPPPLALVPASREPSQPLAPMDPSTTPAIPTLAVPPMPSPPQGRDLIGSVRYLLPLAKAIWARQKAQKTIRALLHGDQRQLDTVLRELGRAAREANLESPAISDEMRRVRAEEERRARAEASLLDLDANAEKERERWQKEEADRNAEVAAREQDIRAAEEELKQKGAERRQHEAVRARFDAEIRAAEKRAAQADARAAKAESTPPEKGGGANTAANARAEAEQARREATSLIPARDEARAKVEALDGPIASLTKQVVDGRAAITQKRKELAEALGNHKRALSTIEADKKRAEGEREGAEREMSQRFVAAGTLLNLHRIDNPRFASIYQRIDELKGGVNAREAAIARLEAERHGFDRAAVQKGLIAVGIALGALILIAILLIVLLARH